MAEGHVCGQYTMHEWGWGGSGGVLSQNIFEI